MFFSKTNFGTSARQTTKRVLSFSVLWYFYPPLVYSNTRGQLLFLSQTKFWIVYRVANHPLFQRTVLYLNPRPCPLLKLELSFISRAKKNLLQKRKKFAKVQSNRGCVAQPMEYRVLTFFFFWRPPCPRAVFSHGGLQTKKIKRSTPDYPPGQGQRVSN